jgi:hypothetical protein
MKLIAKTVHPFCDAAVAKIHRYVAAPKRQTEAIKEAEMNKCMLYLGTNLNTFYYLKRINCYFLLII